TELMLYAFDGLPGIALVPVSVEGFGDAAELDDEIARLVLRLDLAAFLPPEAEEGRFVGAHDHPGVGAADECAALPRSRADLWKSNCVFRHDNLHSGFRWFCDLYRKSHTLHRFMGYAIFLSNPGGEGTAGLEPR